VKVLRLVKINALHVDKISRMFLHKSSRYPTLWAMSLDIKFLESTNGILSGTTWPHPDFVEGIYSLTQQITKCLLTNAGEDMFDPTYGSNIRADIAGIPGQDIESAKRVFSGALQKIIADLKNPKTSDPAERLVDLRLISLKYDPISTTWLSEVEVETEETTFTITPGV
jgi:hypothetical protein